MPKKWAEVESNPAYQSLDPEKKARAQEQYFNQVVAPAVGPAKVEAARSQFMARANRAPQKAEEKTWGQAVKEQIPFTGTVEAISKGQNPYDLKQPEGQSALLGDLGAGAGLGAGVAALGAAPVVGGLALGAGIGAVGEKSGAFPAMREQAQAIRDYGISGASKPNYPENRSEILNLLQLAPREAVATTWDVLPMISTALGTGLAGLGIKGLQGAGPKPMSPHLETLKNAGVNITPAMEKFAETGQRQGVASAVENMTKANPFTQGMVERNQAKAASAIKSGLEKEIAPQSKVATGEALGNVLEAFQVRRGKNVENAKLAARGVGEAPSNVSPGRVASDTIIKRLQEGGVPFDETGFRPDLMKGTEAMGRTTAEALIEVERNIRNAQVPEAMNYLENFDNNYGAKLRQTYGSAADIPMKEARTIIDQSIMKALPKDEAGALTKAKRDYAISQGVVKPALQKVRGNQSNASLFDSLFGKAGKNADKSLDRLSRTMDPQEFATVQDSLASSLVQESQGPNGLSLQKLKSNLQALGDNVKFLREEQANAIKDAIQQMEITQVSELAAPNPSGTANRLLTAQPHALAVGLPTAPFLAAYNQMPALSAALKGGIAKGASKIPLPNPAPLGALATTLQRDSRQ